jgi:hypothetical protein
MPRGRFQLNHELVFNWLTHHLEPSLLYPFDVTVTSSGISTAELIRRFTGKGEPPAHPVDEPESPSPARDPNDLFGLINDAKRRGGRQIYIERLEQQRTPGRDMLLLYGSLITKTPIPGKEDAPIEEAISTEVEALTEPVLTFTIDYLTERACEVTTVGTFENWLSFTRFIHELHTRLDEEAASAESPYDISLPPARTPIPQDAQGQDPPTPQLEAKAVELEEPAALATQEAPGDALTASKPARRRYGANHDLTLEDVRTIVGQCRAAQARGFSATEFYDGYGFDPGGRGYFTLETLRYWLKQDKFASQ